MTPLYNFDYQKTASPGERTPFSDVRLIRDLGILETSEDHSYHLDEIGKELSKTLVNKWTEHEYLIFRADNYLLILPGPQELFMNFRHIMRLHRLIRFITKGSKLPNILRIR